MRVDVSTAITSLLWQEGVGSSGPDEYPFPAAPAEPTGSAKNLLKIDNDNIYIRAPDVDRSGAYAFKVVRNQGSNDAGADHEPWRKERTALIATMSSDPTASGLSYMISSSGSQSLALSAQGSTFAGDYHGGETVLREQWYYWDDSWKEFDPTTSQPSSKGYYVDRWSLLTWPISAPNTAVVFYRLVFDADNGFDLTLSVSGDVVLNGSFAYIPMAMVRNTFVDYEYEYESATVTGSFETEETDLPLDLDHIKVIDPSTLDWARWEFSATTVARLYVLNSVNFTKLYLRPKAASFEALGELSATMKVRYGRDPMPPVEWEDIIDEFDSASSGDSTVPNGWTRTMPTSGATMSSSISSGAWNTAATDTTIHRYVRSLPGVEADGTTVYRYTLDFTTGTAQTSSQLYILKDASGSTSAGNIIVGPINLNNTSPTGSVTGTFTCPAGSVPHAMIAPAANVGRSCSHKKLAITQEP